jgi:hypothetical protein
VFICSQLLRSHAVLKERFEMLDKRACGEYHGEGTAGKGRQGFLVTPASGSIGKDLDRMICDGCPGKRGTPIAKGLYTSDGNQLRLWHFFNLVAARAGWCRWWLGADIMFKRLSGTQWRVLFLRVILGMVCAVFLIRLFLPKAGAGAIAAAAVLLVFFAYVLEAVRQP